jgi:hypothetical protein
MIPGDIKVSINQPYKPWDMGKERPSRNVILAEKTPRRTFNGWDFCPPPAPVEKPRWVEPDQPKSIMYMLASQKAKIQKEEQWMRESQERIRQFEVMSQELEKRKQEELKRQAELKSLQSTVLSTGRGDQSSRQQGISGSFQSDKQQSGRSLEPDQSARSARERAKQSTFSLEDIPASHLRGLQDTHPSVMNNYRALRAQAFLKNHPEGPEAPPPVQQEKRISFRPGGILTRKSDNIDTLKMTGSKSLSQSKFPKSAVALQPIPRTEKELREELKTLVNALERTDEEIERQTLKIALAKKVKTYDKRSSA